MRQVDIAWDRAGERFVATGIGDQKVVVNAPHANEADRTGIAPAELLLVAAGTCSAWDVVEILRKQRQDVAGVDVRVSGVQDEDAPWTFRRINLEFTVRGRGIKRELVDRAVRVSEERYCSVTSTLRLGTIVECAVRVEEIEPAATALAEPGGETA
jgi:putative redox protein